MEERTPRVTEVEHHGINPIPPAEQTSRPRDLFRLAFGGANTFATIILGTLPIAFGLGFWQAASATAAGVLIGALVLAPMALFGPVTRTNNAVSSGAHFGVVGRCVGSFLSLLTAITFFAISVWVSGDAVTGAARRLLGIDGGQVLRAVSYGVIALAVLVVCIYGYRFMLLVNRVAVVLGTAIMLLGIAAYGGRFDPDFAGTGTYALGEFWPTWILAALTAMANPISFGAFLGDWSRYIPATHSRRSLLAAPLLAQMATLLPFGFGLTTATLVTDAGDYITGLTAISPLWYVIPLIVVALIGGLSTGTTALYGTGLDFSSIFTRLSRVQATVLVGSLAVVFIFVGNFALDMVSSINAFATLIVLCTSPWMVIMMIGYWTRRGFYDVADLQVFNEGRKGGRYWFSRGVNWRAMGAWVPATGAGLLTANTPMIAGPLRDIAGGVDVSMVCTLATAAVLYPLLITLFPEPHEVFGPEGPRAVRTKLPNAAFAPLDGANAAFAPLSGTNVALGSSSAAASGSDGVQPDAGRS
ncbi:purine-cytosine permease family protein [Prauserella muralis]|uniref:purine-cytosine permease family protein n=1 Tax=Prauserella muralis TaxID=588067 RepID=UPI000DD2F112|nr:cytosine permease [Prauserella muralis]TWE22019.1 purine-cytosine permease-like protein [Prauserella muralis]